MTISVDDVKKDLIRAVPSRLADANFSVAQLPNPGYCSECYQHSETLFRIKETMPRGAPADSYDEVIVSDETDITIVFWYYCGCRLGE